MAPCSLLLLYGCFGETSFHNQSSQTTQQWHSQHPVIFNSLLFLSNCDFKRYRTKPRLDYQQVSDCVTSQCFKFYIKKKRTQRIIITCLNWDRTVAPHGKELSCWCFWLISNNGQARRLRELWTVKTSHDQVLETTCTMTPSVMSTTHTHTHKNGGCNLLRTIKNDNYLASTTANALLVVGVV